MVSFKGAHFVQDIILTCVRWYLAYPLSYRHVEELMQERGVYSGPRHRQPVGPEVRPRWRRPSTAASARSGELADGRNLHPRQRGVAVPSGGRYAGPDD